MNLPTPLAQVDLTGPVTVVVDDQEIALKDGEKRSILTASGVMDVLTTTGRTDVTEIILEDLVQKRLEAIETPEWQLRNRMISAKKTRGATLSADEKSFLTTYEAAVSAVLVDLDAVNAAIAQGKLPNPLPDLLNF